MCLTAAEQLRPQHQGPHPLFLNNDEGSLPHTDMGWSVKLLFSVVHYIQCILEWNYYFFVVSLVIAKLDILDTFEEVKIGVSYKHKGKVLDSFPGKKTPF